MVVVFLTALAGCGTAPASSPPAGVDDLTIPTPSPDPADYVATVDNSWLPLATGRSWTYEVIDAAGRRELRVTVEPGPEIAGVATTARTSVEQGETTTDWFAQDTEGNVWWFGREGEWQAGEDGAEAGLAMPETPRIGDGFRTAYLAGVVEDVATVTRLDDDVLVVEVTSELPATADRTLEIAEGVGLVEETSPGRTVRLTS